MTKRHLILIIDPLPCTPSYGDVGVTLLNTRQTTDFTISDLLPPSHPPRLGPLARKRSPSLIGKAKRGYSNWNDVLQNLNAVATSTTLKPFF